MKELLTVTVFEDGEMEVFTDYEFPYSRKRARAVIDKDSPLFKGLVKELRMADPDIQYAIQLLDAARRDARYNCEHLHPELEVALAVWRRKKSNELGFSAYVILQQSVLLKIADAAPQSEEELLAISGFGPGKFSKYGQEILAITAAYSS